MKNERKIKKEYKKPVIYSQTFGNKKEVIAQGCDKCPSASNRLGLLQCKQGTTRFY